MATYTRRVNIYINAQQVQDNLYSLRQEARKLTKELTEPKKYGLSDEEIKQKKHLLQDLNRVIKEQTAEFRQSESAIKRTANAFNKYWPMVMGTIGTIAGAVLSIKRLTDSFAELDDAFRDVMKTTGMTQEQVRKLDEELMKIDTRSTRKELLEVAYIAGKLGLTAEEEILGFVRASDKIVIALKKDLGGSAEEAITIIGKLVEVFNLREEFGIEDAIIKVGSAVNALGMASAASEKNIVNFAKRAAGLGNLAKVQVPDILGLGATIDALALSMEVSSTAYGMFMGSMAKNTADFANITGQTLEEFTNLLNVDANEAFIQTLEALNKSGDGFVQLRRAIGEAGLTGQRVVQVMSTLAQQTDFLREQQELARKEYALGTSVLNEFNIKNNSAQAIIEKNQKKILELKQALGEELLPVYQSGQNVIIKFFNYMSSFTGFIINHSKALVTAALAITALRIQYGLIIAPMAKAAELEKLYGAAVVDSTTKVNIFRLAILWFNKTIKGTTQSVKSFNTALSLMGGWVGVAVRIFTVLATTIGSAIAVHKMYNKEQKEGVDVTEEYSRMLKDKTKYLVEEQSHLKVTMEIIKHTNEGSALRTKLIGDLIQKYPIYLGHLKADKVSIDELVESVKILNENLTTSIQLRAYDARIETQRDKAVELMQDQLERQEKIAAKEKELGELRVERDRLQNKESGNLAKIAKLNVKITSLNRELHGEEIAGKKVILGLYDEYERDAELILSHEQNILKAVGDRKKIAEEQRKAETTLLQERLKADTQELEAIKQRAELHQQGLTLSDEQLQKDKNRAAELKIQIKDTEKLLKLQDEIIQRDDTYSEENEIREINALRQQYLNSVYTKEQFEQKKLEIEIDYMEGRLKTIEMEGKETAELEAKILEKRIQIKEIGRKLDDRNNKLKLKNDREFNEQALELLRRYLDGEIATRKEYDDKLLQLEIDSLKRMRDIYKSHTEEYLALDIQLNQKLVQQKESQALYSQKLADATATEELEKENKRFQQKLRELNIQHLTIEQMTEEQYEAYQGLAEEHEQKLQEIDFERVKSIIKAKQNEYQARLAAIHAEASLELEENNTRQNRRRVRREERKKEHDLAKDYIEDLTKLFKELKELGKIEDYNILSDLGLTQEQLDELEKILTKAYSDLGRFKERTQEIRIGKNDIFGFSTDEWERFISDIGKTFDDLAEDITLEDKFKLAGMAMLAMGNVAGQVFKLMSAYEDQHLQRLEERHNTEKENLRDRLEYGLISEANYNDQIKKMDKQLEKEKAKVARQRAAREKTLAIFEATIAGTVEVIKNIGNPALAIIIGAAVAAQIAALAAMPLPDIPGYEKGGFLITREDDKRRFNAQYDPAKRGFITKPTVLVGETKPEYVIPGEGLENPTARPIIQAFEMARLNKNLKTVDFNELLFRTIYNSRQTGGYIAPHTLSGSDTERSRSVQSTGVMNYASSSSAATYPAIETLLQQNISLMQKLDKKIDTPFKSYVALHGDQGFYKAIEKDNIIKSNANL